MAGQVTKAGINRARRLREETGLGLTAPVPDLLALAERDLRVPVIIDRSLPDGLAGAYLPERPVVLLNGEDSAPRLRFTLAHELAHHLFGDRRREDTHAGIVQPGHWIEVRANAFAAELLIPGPAVEAFAAGDPPTVETVVALSDAFGTSLVMSAIRLQVDIGEHTHEPAYEDSISVARRSLPRTPSPTSALRAAAAEEQVV